MDKKDKGELAVFRNELKAVFRIYDEDNSGFLERAEMRVFINELRFTLFLPKCDNDIFRRLWRILDEDNDKRVSLAEMCLH